MQRAANRLRSLFPDGWILADGAWGTELHARGLPIAMPTDLANLDQPDSVRSVAQSYVDAGSQVILTNTFRSNRIALEPFGLSRQVRRLNHRGGEISRESAGSRVRVLGSMGPIGFRAAPEEIRLAFQEQAEALAESGVDGLLCETMIDLTESALAIAAARSTGLPVVASFAAVDSLSVDLAARIAVESGADAVGFNCVDPEDAEPWIRRFRAATDLPCWVRPSAGSPVIVDGQTTHRDRTNRFVQLLSRWIEAGGDFLGGCCGTTPGLIRALAECRRSGGPPVGSTRSTLEDSDFRGDRVGPEGAPL